jgi:hypothetical protein
MVTSGFSSVALDAVRVNTGGRLVDHERRANLRNAGVNIEGLCGVRTGGGQAEIHVLVEDLSPALNALAAGEIEVASELEVAVLKVEDRPVSWAR